jgi:4-hydroxybenzoate polyprenyltransferase
MSPQRALLRALRIHQWVKNLLVFAGAIFSGLAIDSSRMRNALVGSLAFCLVSSATYLFNDLRDASADRLHPTKRFRPIAARTLPIPLAVIAAIGLLTAGLALSWWIEALFFQIVLLYLASNLLYSLGLKRVVILDVMLVAFGFVLRAVAGAAAVGVAASSWIVVCSLELAMLIVLGKRRADLLVAEQAGTQHLLPADWYTMKFVELLMATSASASIVTYAMYTLAPETIERVGSRRLVLTLPMVVYGCLRYLYLAQSDRTTDDPALLLVSDRGMQLCGIIWIASALFAVYV